MSIFSWSKQVTFWWSCDDDDACFLPKLNGGLHSLSNHAWVSRACFLVYMAYQNHEQFHFLLFSCHCVHKMYDQEDEIVISLCIIQNASVLQRIQRKICQRTKMGMCLDSEVQETWSSPCLGKGIIRWGPSRFRKLSKNWYKGFFLK